MTSTKRHGLYVVIEGTQGVGKSTQIKLLADRLTKAGYIVRNFREPDGQTNITAREIRKITQNPFYPINTKAEVLLYNAARAQSLETIMQTRQQGIICLCDRNYLSTLAVQYYGRGDITDYEKLNEIISFAVDSAEPDITVVLDAPVNTLQQRAKKRGGGEKFDNLDLEFLERVRAGYLIEAKKRNYPVVTATGNEQQVSIAIWDILHGKNVNKYKANRVSISAKPANNVQESRSMQEDTTEYHKFIAKPVSILLCNQIIATRLADCSFDYITPYTYYIPKTLKSDIKKQYCKYTDEIFQLYTKAYTEMFKYAGNNKLTEQILQQNIANMLPVATNVTLNIRATQPSTIKLIKYLHNSALPEANDMAKQLSKQAISYGIDPKLLAVNKRQPNAIKSLVDKIELNYSSGSEGLILTDYSPRNELDLVADIIYQYSNLSMHEINEQTEKLSYKHKTDLLQKYINDKSIVPTALNKATYSWDVLSSYRLYSEFLLNNTELGLVAQPLSPRFGYDIPIIVETSGITEQYLDCFDLSLELCNILQKNGYDMESQYATLMGHKMRWQVAHNGLQAKELFKKSVNAETEYANLIKEMHQKLQDTHSILFINQKL